MAAKARKVEDGEPLRALTAWEAGFIADAHELHLAMKPMFAGVILAMLERESVRRAYAEANPQVDMDSFIAKLRRAAR